MPGSADLMEGMEALDRAIPAYARRWRYYADDLPETFASERIRAMVERSAAAYRFRLARIPVESIANRVAILAITAANDRANRAIDDIRHANDMELQEPFIHERMFVFGDAYLMAWPVEPDEMDDPSRPIDADVATVGVELRYQSPMSCRAMYDTEDGRTVRYVIRRWKEKNPFGEVWRAEVWYSDRMESWITQPGAKGTDPNEWLPYAENAFGDPVPAIPGENWPEPHDFGEIPIKHARSDLPYGRSELEDFSGAQNAITKATATQASSIEAHGWPERYRIADDKAILEQARDTVPWGDVADAPDASLSTVSGRSAGPGVEHTYHGTREVGEFAAPDIANLIDPIDAWIRWGSAATGTPLGEFDPRFGAQMSGVAWDRAEKPLRAKEADRKRFLLRFWREVYGLALVIVGIHDFGEIEVQWAPPEVINDPEWWTVAQVRRGFGIPERQILTEANYTAEQIDEWERQQDDALLLDSRIDRMLRLGEAMQTLGAGAQSLGVPPERIASLVETLLGEAGSPGKLTLEEKPEPPAIPPPLPPEQEQIPA